MRPRVLAESFFGVGETAVKMTDKDAKEILKNLWRYGRSGTFPFDKF